MTRQNGIEFRLLLDVVDWPRVSQRKWRVTTDGKFVTGKGMKQANLPQFILGNTSRVHVRHRNGDSLDYRKCNLRPANLNDFEIDSASGATVMVVESKHGTFRTLIDSEDKERISAYPWSVIATRFKTTGGVYFITKIDRKTVSLHRFILNAPDRAQVDHREPSRTLDNRKSNLRLATRLQNSYNRRKQRNATGSRYKGVCARRRRGELVGWEAYIRGRNGREYVDAFARDRELEAARAYDCAALEHHGEFARINFPLSDYILKAVA